jgi:hypothetical protein
MTPLKSSNLDAAHYDEPSRTLHVRFKSGQTYSYAGVPPHHHSNLMNADSPGGYFAKHIRQAFPAKAVKEKA